MYMQMKLIISFPCHLICLNHNFVHNSAKNNKEHIL